MGETLSGFQAAAHGSRSALIGGFKYVVHQWEWWIIPSLMVLSFALWGAASSFIQTAYLQHREDRAAIQKFDDRLDAHAADIKARTKSLADQLKDAKVEIKRLERAVASKND